MEFDNALIAQQAYFKTGATKPYDFRKLQLQKLLETIIAHEENIYTALYKDLKKSKEECWVSENGFVIGEIKKTIKQLKSWMAPQKVPTNLANFPSSSYRYKEPMGVVLIIAPWNYPFNLLFTPLVGAIAAGNCVVLKSSEFAPAISAVMKQIIQAVFDLQYVLYVEGDGAEVVPALMKDFRFDHVFYTGSTFVGKKVYQAAAEKLTPVTLELGGKSPCVVAADADIKVAANRIVFAKFLNAGQTCIAPDYILVHHTQKAALTKALQHAIQEFYTADEQSSYDYGRIINEKQFDRLVGYLKNENIAYGGQSNRAEKYIQPTLIDDVKPESQLMKDEIFGPILPIISYRQMSDALTIIEKNSNPLAFYLFTNNSNEEAQWLDSVAFGGGCVNNAALHLTNHHLPFGGRGNSGIGQYHGEASFTIFSHQKSVLKTATWLDVRMKYPPFKGKLQLLKKLIG